MQDDRDQVIAAKTGWISLLFILAGAVSGIWVAGSPSWFSTLHRFPNTAFTTLLFLAGAAAQRRGVPRNYQWSIVAGLGCSATGDAFLMQSRDHFLAGLASFLAAHVCYLWALTRDCRLAGRRAPFVVWGLLGLTLVWWLWPGVENPLRVPVAVYALALVIMAAQAASRAALKPDRATLLAAVGAGFFVVSDSLLAFQRFRHPLEFGHVLVLGTYFIAQASIALSVVLYQARRT